MREHPLDIGERVRLMRDGIFNFSSRLLSAVIGVALVPIMLHGLGAEAYGVWVAALTLTALLGALDFGLSWGVTREVAGASDSARAEEARAFVRGAATAYLLLGLAGGAAVALLGIPLSNALHLEAAERDVARLAFGLAGVGFLADQSLVFSIAVLHGLRRFGLASVVSIAVLVLRATGIALIVWADLGLVEVMIWQVAVSAGVGAAALQLVTRTGPLAWSVRPGRSQLRAVTAHARFGLASQWSTAALRVIWDVGPILVGVVGGTAAIAAYHVGQKFPIVLSALVWSVAGALFPAAREKATLESERRSADVLAVVLRWSLLLALPFAVLFWVLGPQLLEAWLGTVSSTSIWVLRLTSLAVVLDAVGVAGLHLLWARGAMRTLMVVLTGAALATVGLSLALLAVAGPVGAAWGLLAPVAAAAFALLVLGARAVGRDAGRLLTSAASGLILPALACAGVALTVAGLTAFDNRLEILLALAGGGAAYAIVLYAFGARREEQLLAREAVLLPVAIGSSAYRPIRRLLGRGNRIRRP